MTAFFKPYEGSRPYVFISYSHRQSASVVETIRLLHDRRYRLWYDEGIPAGSDWPANIARHMDECERVIFFLSATALESPNCFSEIRTAARLGKPVMVVRLDDAVPDGEWTKLLSDRETLSLTDDPAARVEAILRSRFLPERFRRRRGEGTSFRWLFFLFSFALFIAAAGLFAAMVSGHWSPYPSPAPPVAAKTPTPAPSPTAVPVIELGEAEKYFAVRFPDTLQERAVRRALGMPKGEIYRWQLADISALFFCGNLVTDDLENVAFDADGVCRVNGAPVIQGPVEDLGLLRSAVKLERLALICQPAKDAAAVNGHVLLRELSLAGSRVRSLDGIGELPSLETLHLEHTGISDLQPLDALPSLRTVTVSRDMLPLRWDDSAVYCVELVIDKDK